MATATVDWEGTLVSQPAGSTEVAEWHIHLYDATNTAVDSATEPLAALTHVFDVSALADGMYHAGVSGVDASGAAAGNESMSAEFALPVPEPPVMVHRPGMVTVTLAP